MKELQLDSGRNHDSHRFRAEKPEDEDALVVGIADYEGPLDLLLEMVKNKKIDVGQVSVLDVVDQFLDWMHRARDVRLELAADWLFMAATLAWLKSKLLLPVPKEERAEAEGIVEELNARLRRVQAINKVADELLSRRRLGQHWHAAGDTEEEKGGSKRLETTLYALLVAYVREAKITLAPPTAPVRKPFLVFSVEEAIRMLENAPDFAREWIPLLKLLPTEPPKDVIHARSRVASSYVAALELAKRGEAEVSQIPDERMVMVRRVGEPA